jgi:hypothetical protein
MTDTATISIGWLVNIIILLLIGVASYFLKRVGETIGNIEVKMYEHDKEIALLQAEQKVQDTKIANNESSIDKIVLNNTVKDATREPRESREQRSGGSS